MKKVTLFIFILLAMLQSMAQDYQISFVGTGGSTLVDSVQVKNLTQNTGLSLNGTDVLHLMGVVGIDPGARQCNNGMHVYPNPTFETAFVEFETASPGTVNIGVSDITGKPVTQTQIMLSCGTHIFAVTGLSGGMYTVIIRSAGFTLSGKIVCTGTAPGSVKVRFISTQLKSGERGSLKSTRSLVAMQYDDGDQLLFKCFSGIFATVVPLVPTQSQTITANFASCTDADNHNYATVTIGTQTWMAENLNVGTRINGTLNQANNGIIEKYCYDDNVGNCNIYGGMYQWTEMMQYSTTPGVQGICPSGWHVPTDADWCTMTTYLDPTVNCGTVGQYTGTDVGGLLKSTGTIEDGTGLWSSPNTGATDASGFSYLPAGLRSIVPNFNSIGKFGDCFSSNDSSSLLAFHWGVRYGNSFIYRGTYKKAVATSVRCIRDEDIPFTCGSPVTVNHVAGAVAPVDKTVTYGTVNGIPGESSKCWITSNLGADHQATAVDDTTEASAGWYWQFNLKQGFKHTGIARTPNTTWIATISENSDWIQENDPCTLELGSGWRIPTNTEWINIDAGGNWTDWTRPWNSDLKLHAAGLLDRTNNGSLTYRGSQGRCWSITQTDATRSQNLNISIAFSFVGNNNKAYGYSVRCLRD